MGHMGSDLVTSPEPPGKQELGSEFFLWQPGQARRLQWVYWLGGSPRHFSMSVFLLPMPSPCRLWLLWKLWLKLLVNKAFFVNRVVSAVLCHFAVMNLMSEWCPQLSDDIEWVSAHSETCSSSTLGVIPCLVWFFIPCRALTSVSAGVF